MQLKKHSLIESVTNVAVGYGVALASQIAIFPVFGIEVTLKDNVMIGAFFTVVSIVRSYILRRIFTRLTEHEDIPWMPKRKGRGNDTKAAR